MKTKLFALLAFFLGTHLYVNSQTTSDPLGTGLLWEISGNGLKKKSYVLGTIHIIPEKDYFFPKYYTKALKATEVIVMEINMTDILGQLEVIKMSKLPDGKELKDFYDERTYQEIVDVARDSFGVNIEMIKTMKPIFIQQQLSTNEMMTGTMMSYEMELVKMGMQMDKSFDGLETAKEQMTILDSISLEEQATMLLESIRNVKQENADMDKLIQFYKDQQLDSLNALFEKGDYDLADHENSLLGNRNRKWIPQMEAFMKKAPIFFAVGAGHLGGNQGVINLLRQKGYTVTPITK